MEFCAGEATPGFIFADNITVSFLFCCSRSVMEDRTLSAACLGTCIRDGGREVVSRRGSEWERGREE